MNEKFLDNLLEDLFKLFLTMVIGGVVFVFLSGVISATVLNNLGQNRPNKYDKVENRNFKVIMKDITELLLKMVIYYLGIVVILKLLQIKGIKLI